MSKPRSGSEASETPEQRQFAEKFPDEARLRIVIAQLLESHGTNEKGKDTVFYESSALSGRRLCACVVKNERITGKAGATSGAGTVLQQAVQALTEPFPNRSTGQDERVACLFSFLPACLCPSRNGVDSGSGRLHVRTGLPRSGTTLTFCHQSFQEYLAARDLTNDPTGQKPRRALASFLTRKRLVARGDGFLHWEFGEPSGDATLDAEGG
jgi:hypothetical protein